MNMDERRNGQRCTSRILDSSQILLLTLQPTCKFDAFCFTPADSESVTHPLTRRRRRAAVSRKICGPVPASFSRRSALRQLRSFEVVEIRPEWDAQASRNPLSCAMVELPEHESRTYAPAER